MTGADVQMGMAADLATVQDALLEVTDALYLSSLRSQNRKPNPAGTFDAAEPVAVLSDPPDFRAPTEDKEKKPANPNFLVRPTAGDVPPATALPSQADLFAEASSAMRNTAQEEAPPARTVPASRLRVPSGRALSNPLGVARALRPILKRVPSRTQRVLDIEATVERAARDGLLERTRKSVRPPEMRPLPVRWLAVDLLVDRARTMAPWRETIEEFFQLLTASNGFRAIRRWDLFTEDNGKERPVLQRRLSAYQKAGAQPEWQGPERAAKALKGAEPAGMGNRVVLVLTDCMGQGWHDGSCWEFLAACGIFASTSLVQVLPENLWSRTAMLPVEGRVRSEAAGAFNHRLSAPTASTSRFCAPGLPQYSRRRTSSGMKPRWLQNYSRRPRSRRRFLFRY